MTTTLRGSAEAEERRRSEEKREEHDLARDQEPGVLGELGRVRDEIHAIL